MKWIVMVRGEDGIEFRYSENEFDDESGEGICQEYKQAEEDYPCGGVFITTYKGREYFEDIHQRRYDNDEGDLY